MKIIATFGCQVVYNKLVAAIERPLQTELPNPYLLQSEFNRTENLFKRNLINQREYDAEALDP